MQNYMKKIEKRLKNYKILKIILKFDNKIWKFLKIK
jgi:hypothetical protein